MNNETQIINLQGFRGYLINEEYSKNVITVYTRKAKKFLESMEMRLASYTDYEELKKIITEYLDTIPLTSQKEVIQASLHTYYNFISGNRFYTRLYAKDFDVDMFIEAEIERFRKHLSEVAGLSNNTIISRCNTIQIFLYSNFPGIDFSPEKVTADIVREYFTQKLQHISAASKKTIIVRIRSYIKFLGFTYGVQAEEILKLPMTSPVWKRAGLPKYLTDEELGCLFSVCDKTNQVGLRNYAIVRCLKDLGIRCSEAAGLSLDDFDWLQGTVKIKQTKSHTERILPLPTITGQAIEAYLLYSRPNICERVLFVRFKNEKGQPMGTSQVRSTVRRAAVKAGLSSFTGTHMLRHTAAKEMINNGISLKTIADVLGHKSVETTLIYTKLNFMQLKDVAGIWPGVRA